MQVQIGAASKFLKRIWSHRLQGYCFDQAFCFRNMSGAGNVPKHKHTLRQSYPVRKPISTQSVIEGTSTESGRKTQEIASVIEDAVKSPNLDYSHFISLPLAGHPKLVHKLQKFQNSILGYDTPGAKTEVQNEKEQVRGKTAATDVTSSARGNSSTISSELGIDKSIFIKPTTFHLTVLMLKLWNKDRVAAAAEVLRNISSQVNNALDNRAVSIRLKGLECMRGSPAKARVVYAPVEEIGGEGRLLCACQIIIEAFVKAGLVLEKDAQHTLKLHATLMNAKHRKKEKKTKGQDFFDARGIFLRYGSEHWGDYPIQEVHLSQRFKYDEGGYYHCCASIPFPDRRTLVQIK